MPQKQLDISRRRLLAGLGTAGVAAVGAGLGTTAYLSDTETFDGNSLVAGELDLIASWKEVVYQGGDEDNVDYYVDVPDEELPMPGTMVTYDGTDYDVLKVYPGGTGTEPVDTDNELPNLVVGIQDLGAFEETYVDEEVPTSEAAIEAPCENRGEWVNGDEDPPEIDVSDVKPGDFGEVTLDFHLCGNPGYVWLQGELMESGEGDPTFTEPELSDEHEDGDVEDGTVELLDAVQTRLWRDDGDNLYEPGVAGNSCNVLVLDESGSIDNAERAQLRTAVGQLLASSDSDDDATLEIPHGVVEFSTEGSGAILHPLSENRTTLSNEVNGIDTTFSPDNVYGDEGGSTDIQEGIALARDVYSNDAQSDDPLCEEGDETFITVVTDGVDNEPGDPVAEADAARDEGHSVIVVGIGDDVNQANLEAIADSPDLVFTADFDDINELFDEIAEVIGAGEGELFQGSLRELLTELSDDGIVIDAAPGGDEVEPFPNSFTEYLGLEWWVPPDGLNEIQGDQASFNLGFYTEQERHNEAPPVPVEEEFVSLFDGESLEGWHQINGEAEYYIEDGAIVGETVYPSPNSFLTTYKMFDDFDLRMEVARVPPDPPEPLNSGIQVRSNSSETQPEVHGPQAEIGLSNNPMFPPPQPGRVWGESLGTGWMSTSDPTTVFNDSEWNDYRIRAVDDQLEVWVNSTKTADVDLGEFDDVEGLIPMGFVGLQVHGVGEEETGRTVRWRNIEIKELDTEEWTGLPPAHWSNATGSGSVSVSGDTIELSNGASFFVHSDDTYDDFVFETWVMADAEGGLLFRNDSDSAATGYRVDIDPTDEEMTGSLYNSGAGSYLKDISTSGEAAHLQSAFHPDEWNYLRVQADGDDIRVWVNGITTADLTNGAHDDGYLGLQHMGGSGTIQFREMAINPIEDGG